MTDTRAMTAAVLNALTSAIESASCLLSTGQESADTATVLAMVPLLWSSNEIFEALRRRMAVRCMEG
ncbi:hypothetical protein [Nitratireductor aquibiodomus]|uniref:hypothetical protein n=1 Tax=Nitratireductor aquibiodomus TaxID=204799 RepID=UPI0011600539|nr:hypothetical protein [Nitratireductor aquibiodomus]